MQPNYLDERLPRYTSYPTAPHFSTAVGASDYRRWLAELRGGRRKAASAPGDVSGAHG